MVLHVSHIYREGNQVTGGLTSRALSIESSTYGIRHLLLFLILLIMTLESLILDFVNCVRSFYGITRYSFSLFKFFPFDFSWSGFDET